MTYPDDVLKAAREAAAKYWENVGWPEEAQEIRSGFCDKYPAVRAACIAIMDERQRCAGIAAQEAHNAVSSASKAAATAIACAILGQREALARKFRAPSDEVMKGVT